MAVPTNYTDDELLSYMVMSLGEVARYLRWDAETFELQEALNDTLLACDATTASDVTDIKKLRSLARYHAFEAAQTAAMTHIQPMVKEEAVDRQVLFDMLAARLSQAWAQAFPYLGSSYAVSTATTRYVGDPYVNDPDAEEDT